MNNQHLSAGEAALISNASPANQVTGLGQKLKNALAIGVSLGTKFYLDPVNGNDDFDGLSAQTAFKTLPYAYAKLTANKNEILYIIGGASALNLSSAFTWAKSYTHLIGLASELRFGGRVRIGHNANFTTLFTVSASGCIFHNIHWQMGRGSTTNVVCVSVTGLRNQFSNCHFEAPLHATEGGGTQAWRALAIGNSAQANTFKSCTFGTWTTTAASANGALVGLGTDVADTHFDDCLLMCWSGSTSMQFVKSGVDLGGEMACIFFNNCRFIMPAVATLPAIDAAFGAPSNGNVFISNCHSVGITAWSAASAKVFVSNATSSKTGGQGQNPT